MQRLRVLHIIPSLNKGGAERLVIDICKCLSSLKLAEVLLVVLSTENEYPESIENVNIKHCSSKVIPSLSGKSKVYLDDFVNIVNDFKPNIIHSHLFEAEILSRWKIFSEIKYVTHCHDNIRQYRNFELTCLSTKSCITEFYEKKIIFNRYRKCKNNFIAVSVNNENYLKQNLPKELHKITLLNNAIDFHKFKNTSRITKSIADKNNIELVTVGRLDVNKNQSFLVDVVKMLNDKGYNTTLEILGDGPTRQSIENKISALELSEKIFCRGNINDVEKYLHQSDIYVHSALSESFGLVMLETMAAGLPVVCLDAKGNRDIIENGKNGFMIYDQNCELFADKIIKLIEDKELYNSISNYAIAFAAKYDIKIYVQNLLDLYNSLFLHHV